MFDVHKSLLAIHCHVTNQKYHGRGHDNNKVEKLRIFLKTKPECKFSRSNYLNLERHYKSNFPGTLWPQRVRPGDIQHVAWR